MGAFNPADYPQGLAELLTREEEAEVGPGKPKRAVRAHLRALDWETPFAPKTVMDRGMAAACLSGLWLLHNFLDESHTISQEIESPTGSFWHGIMHRREGDFSNAKYWFRRVDHHFVYEPLCAAARELAAQWPVADGSASFLHDQHTWDPAGFVDLCESVVRGRSKSERLCRRIVRREWELLFDFCYRQAVAE